MLTILVVDDEKPMRQWYVYCINQSGRDYLVIGQAANGKEALDLFKRHKPDVVITDIKMPVMDGIELMNKIKEIEPRTDIVLLTCHADFNYARQAVKLGASEYLLKTEIEDEDLIQLLDRLDSKRKSENSIEESLRDYMQIQRNACINNLLQQTPDNYLNIREELNKLKILVHENNLFSVAFRFFNNDSVKSMEYLISNSCFEEVENVSYFEYKKHILLLTGNVKAVPSQLYMITSLNKWIRDITGDFACSVGAGSICHDIKSLPFIMRESVCALRKQYFNGTASEEVFKDFDENKEKLTQFEKKEQDLIHSISMNNIESVSKELAHMFDILEKGFVKDIDRIEEMCKKILHLMLNKMQEATCTGVDHGIDIDREVSSKKTFIELKIWILPYINGIIHEIRKGKKYSPSVRTALEHMENRFGEDLSLESLAKVVHLNPDYFSRVFKEETGKNFSVYLMQLRLQKAQQLIRDTDLNIYDIAQLVGYKNLSHFSKIFKSYTGKKASSYKNTSD